VSSRGLLSRVKLEAYKVVSSVDLKKHVLLVEKHMSKNTTLQEKALIKKLTELGRKSPEIAKVLKMKVRTVRKYVQLVKKGLTCLLPRVVPKWES